MLFSEFGQLLSDARIKKGLSIDDVAIRLKISAKVVHALENGNLSDLLHGAYVCSFIKTYGNFLELDPDQIEHIINSVNVENISQYMPLPTTRCGVFDANFKYVIALMFLLIITAGGIWYAVNPETFPYSFNTPKLLTIVEPIAPKQDNALKAEKPSKIDDKTQTANKLKIEPTIKNLYIDAIAKTEKSAVPNEPQKAESKNKASATNKKPALDDNKNIDKTEEFTLRDQDIIQEKTVAVQTIIKAEDKQKNVQIIPPTTKVKDIYANANNDNNVHKMIITAKEECWISSNADGINIRQFSLQKGNTFAISFKDKLILRLGNAGGILIRYNGKDLPPVGKIGEVKTITFPREQE